MAEYYHLARNHGRSQGRPVSGLGSRLLNSRFEIRRQGRFPCATPWPTLLAKVGKEGLKSSSVASFAPHFDLCGNRETGELSQLTGVACAANSKFAI
jgi:hypothetical protein